MEPNRFRCDSCDLFYASTAALGRHLQNSHRRRRQSTAPPNSQQLNSVISGQQEQQCDAQTDNDADHDRDLHSDFDSDAYLQSVSINSCIADEVIEFYDSFEDASEPVYSSVPDLKIPFEQLNDTAAKMFEFCCTQKLSCSQMSALYHIVPEGSDTTCGCSLHFHQLFPTKAKFVRYVHDARRAVVFSQGWERVLIQTAFGLNNTGVFRSIIPLITSIVETSGGISAVLQCNRRFLNGNRIYSNPLDTNSMCSYYESVPRDTMIIGMDIYSDGTTLSNSGSQSICVLRMRLVNVQGASEKWHEIGMEPVMKAPPTCSASVLSEEKALLKQRFLFVALRKAIEASRTGFILCGKLVFLRLSALVCDQKEERSLLSLRSQGSYMDCTHCLLPSLPFNDNWNTSDSTALPADAFTMDADIYHTQTNNDVEAPLRSVVNTVSRQIFVSRAKRNEFASNNLFNFDRRHVATAKRYLRRTSSSLLPPALAAVYGLGTAPFNLYKCVALDKLHSVDLGILRVLPDFAFKLFNSTAYNKGVISGRDLVRTANCRFRSIQHVSGVYVLPFRATGDEKHANMTGKIRRDISPFLWVALLGLQPHTSPDSDAILQCALAMNHFQTLIRGINQNESTRQRTVTDIINIQRVAFECCLWLSQSLALPISTKLHRVMRHVADHLLEFGCSRRGDSDANETLHKTTKSSIRASNRRLDQVAIQILSNRCIADMLTENSNNESFTDEQIDSHHESAENETTDLASDNSSSSDSDTTEHSNLNASVANPVHFKDPILELNTAISFIAVDDISHTIREIRHPVTLESVWKTISRVRFKAFFSWKTIEESVKQPVYQVAYSRKKSSSNSFHRDAVQYRKGNNIEHGVIQSLLKNRFSLTTSKAAIIRRLEEIPPDPNNSRVVTVYGHKRFAYAYPTSQCASDVLLDCISITDFRCVIPLVYDMYDVSTRFSVTKKTEDIEDTLEERKRAKFFIVNGKQVTAHEGYSGLTTEANENLLQQGSRIQYDIPAQSSAVPARNTEHQRSVCRVERAEKPPAVELVS